MTDLKLFDTRAYQAWVSGLKERIQKSQLKAAVRVNTELILMYWQLGEEIVTKQQEANWGDALIDQLAKDLCSAFPQVKGFSRTNLFYIRKWYLFYQQAHEIVPLLENDLQRVMHWEPGQELVPQAVGLIPWGHNREIITKCTDVKEALFYVSETIRQGWSRSVLVHQIESRLFQRQGKALTNFALTLPKPQADLAEETLKNPYNFDFLTLGPQARERDLEEALANQISKFLLELGQGFAYMGRQYRLNIAGDDFYLDLLMYHTKLRCHVVVELKVTEFQPEFAGKLNFYLNAVDAQLRHPSDNPSIGILLCKTPNKVVVEYSLKNMSAPLGVAEYQWLHAVPEDLQGDLPTIEALEQELEKEHLETEAPVHRKLKQLKGLIERIDREEVQKGKDNESVLWLFDEVIPRLEGFITKYLEEIIPLFKAFFLMRRINSTSHIEFTADDLAVTLDREPVNQLGITLQLEGFKKGGTKAFNLYKELYFTLHPYHYRIGLSWEEVWEERLYHQEWTDKELQELALRWCEHVIESIMVNIERMDQ